MSEYNRIESTASIKADVSLSFKEGWLFKRGKYLKIWRPRYFILHKNGNLMKYKKKPKSFEDYSSLQNYLSVKGSQIMPADKPKPYTFIIRCNHITSIIERAFYVDTEGEREEWIAAIKLVAEINNIETSENSISNNKGSGVVAIDDLTAKLLTLEASYTKSSEEKKVTLENFELMKVLGRGTFGKVILSREKETAGLYAIKILKKRLIIGKEEINHTLREYKILKTVEHPFLIAFRSEIHTVDLLCFVMEFACGGDLFFHLNQEGVFGEERTKFYGAEITSALSYFHEKGIIYRDLKLENLLLDEAGHIKVADFGLCTYESMDFTKTICGTPAYVAPEVLEGDQYGKAIDWWGLGVIMYEMLCGKLPFFDENHEKLFMLILTEEVKFPSIISIEARGFLAALLRKNPKERLGGGPDDAQEIMNHSFFISVNWVDLLQKKIKPEFIPQLIDETSTQYFDSEFTEESVELTPPEKPSELLVTEL